MEKFRKPLIQNSKHTNKKIHNVTRKCKHSRIEQHSTYQHMTLLKIYPDHKKVPVKTLKSANSKIKSKHVYSSTKREHLYSSSILPCNFILGTQTTST